MRGYCQLRIGKTASPPAIMLLAPAPFVRLVRGGNGISPFVSEKTIMDMAHFDKRNYPIRSVREGYGEWAATYEDIVLDAMDLRLFARIRTVPWERQRVVADLACGT